MAVYVDDVSIPFRNMKMCHMWASSDAELLAMMDKIGVQRKWIQGHPTLSFEKHKDASWIHADICQSKRALAIRYGAIVTDRYGPLEHVAKLDCKSKNDETRAHGKRVLERIERLRGKEHN